MKPIAFAGLFLCLLQPLAFSAEEEQEDHVYRYRSDVMEVSAKHLKALQRYVKGQLEIKDHVPAHVDALLDLNDMYKDLFPPGKQHPESEALPAIWSDPRGFQQSIQYNRRRIMTLKKVDPSDIKRMKRAVNELRMSCGDCHYYFRER